MSNSRTVVKNSIVGTVSHMCSMVFGFITQRVFLAYLGLEINGINGVIGDTLGFLSLAELGVGTAISYRLYRPLAAGDKHELTLLMQLYQKLYQIIGVVVFLVGMIAMIFLPVFINDSTLDMDFIRAAYVIQLFSTASTYFFAYKTSLIYADQKQSVCKIVDISCNIAFSVVRIIVLVCFQSYHIYLLVQLLQRLTCNFILAYYCDNHYGYVKQKTSEKYQDISGMFKDIKDVLFGKIASYVYNSTDNLVISTFSGIVLAGGFSNYKYVTSAVNNLITGMTDSITATIGNSIQQKNTQQSYGTLCRYSFIRYAVANVAVTGLCICTDALVGFAFGIQYVMDFSVLYLMVTDIFIKVVYAPLSEYITVLGYFRYEKYIDIVGALMNIVLSIVLVQFMGVQGVLIGTCISQLFFWISKSILLCWKYFGSWDKLRELWTRYIGYAALTIGQILLLHILKNQLLADIYTLWAFLIEGVCSVMTSIVGISIFYGRTEEYRYLLEILKKIYLKCLKKRRV